MYKSILVYIFFLAIVLKSKAQFKTYTNYGFNVGLVAAFGTHINRLGLVVQGYYNYDFAQINASIRVYNNFKNLGPKGNHVELSSAIGACFGYGKKTKENNLFLSSISNQTNYINSIGYSYNFWFNKIKTSQVTGIIALQFNNISIISENDLLAKPMLDRFRTAAILIQYQNEDFQYGINCTLWTGKMGSEVRNDSIFPYCGYLNTEGGIYSNLSHGLLSGQVKYANQYGQYLQANAGIDAEQVRNGFQNRLVHDMILLPKKWYKPINCHVPMIDSNKEQYLYRPNQKIKKANLFLNGYASPNIFY